MIRYRSSTCSQGPSGEAVKTEEGQASLVSSLRGVREGVAANLDRVNEKLRAEQAMVAALQTR
jgi:hypothetical protein